MLLLKSLLQAANRSDTLKLEEIRSETPPYTRDPQRIAQAVYSQGSTPGSPKEDLAQTPSRDEWTDIPTRVAGGIIRNMLAQVNYDTLYSLKDPREFYLVERFKPSFIQRLKYQGVISYQFIYRRGGLPPSKGDRIETPVFRISPVQSLRNSKPLRDRGIMVIHAGISKLKPTDPAVMQQRFENWRARWQQEADMVKAEGELEVMRIISQARAEKRARNDPEAFECAQDVQLSGRSSDFAHLSSSGRRCFRSRYSPTAAS